MHQIEVVKEIGQAGQPRELLRERVRVDFKFVTSDKITSRNALSLSNNLVYLYVVDVLYAALLADNKALRRKKLNSDALLGANQTVDNYLFEY